MGNKMKEKAFCMMIIAIMVLCIGCSTEDYVKEMQEKRGIQAGGSEEQNSQTEMLETQEAGETGQQEQKPAEEERQEIQAAEETKITDRLLIFHNGQGPMCLQALAFLDSMKQKHPGFTYEEHLTTTAIGRNRLIGLEQKYRYSEGVSSDFGYLPIIFINEKSYSGFTSFMGEDIENDIKKIWG